MSIIETVYAAGSTDVILNTVEIFSDAWDDPIVLVQDNSDHEIITEDERTLIAKQCGMAVALPKRDNTGAQNLTFAVDGARPEASGLIRSAIRDQVPVYLTYRCYLLSDLSEPAETPYYLVVRSMQAQADHIELTAGLFDLIDMRWPRNVYNSINAPGLRYIQ